MRPAWLIASMMLIFQPQAHGEQREMKIGIAAPLSGVFSPIGEQIVGGAQSAAEVLAGKNLSISIEPIDDKCERDTAKAAANQFVGAKMVAVIGHVCWGASLVGAEIYHQAGIVQISPATRSETLTRDRPDPAGGVYRLAPRAEDEGVAAARFLAREFADARIAVLNDGSVYGKQLSETINTKMRGAGVMPALLSEYEPGEADYGGVAARLEADAIDVAFIAGYHTEAALIALAIDRRGLKTVVAGGEALLTDEFGSLAGAAAEGVYAVGIRDFRFSTSAQAAAVALLAREIEPEPYTLTAYAAVEILAAAISESTGGFTDLKNALNTMEFETAIGKVRFAQSGDSNVEFWSVYLWRNGTFRSIDKPDDGTANQGQ